MDRFGTQTQGFADFHTSSRSLNEFQFDDEEIIAHSNTVNDVDFLRSKYKQGSNKVHHDFFKTKMCNLFLLNICKKGEECPFAHNPDELREKPNLYKTKLCQAFLEGHCNNNNCCFAHGEEELRSTPDLFKTAICNLWVQGRCTSGPQCRFAHGNEDLRPAPSHHKVKKNKYNKAFGSAQNQNYNSNQRYPPETNQTSPFKYSLYPDPIFQFENTESFSSNNNNMQYIATKHF